MPDEQPATTDAKSDIVSVNNDNMEAFYADILGLPKSEAEGDEAPSAALEGELVDDSSSNGEPEQKAEETKPKKKNSFQERISELTAEKNAAKEEAARQTLAREALETRIAALEKPIPPADPIEQSASKKPDISTYTDVGQYEADLTAYNREMFQAELRAEQSAKAQLQIEQTWEEKKAAFKAETPDYEDVIGSSNLQISDIVKEAIVDSDIGPQLAYHLATNPEITAHLKTLSLASQAREIGKIEAGLAKPPAAPAKPPAQASKAPQPISPIKSAVTTTDNKVDADGEFHGTYDEYKALRKAGKIK